MIGFLPATCPWNLSFRNTCLTFRIYMFVAFTCDLCSEYKCTQLRICHHFPQYESLFPLGKLLRRTSILMIIIATLFFLETWQDISICTSRNFLWCTNVWVQLTFRMVELPTVSNCQKLLFWIATFFTQNITYITDFTTDFTFVHALIYTWFALCNLHYIQG